MSGQKNVKISSVKLSLYVLAYIKLAYMLTYLLKSWYMDEYYYPCTLEELQKVIEFYKEFIEKEHVKYIVDRFDCDDYAKLFSAIASALLKKNSIGIAIGKLYLIENGEKVFLGYHAWNIALVLNNKQQIEILFIEPQTQETFKPNRTTDNFYYELIAVIW